MKITLNYKKIKPLYRPLRDMRIINKNKHKKGVEIFDYNLIGVLNGSKKNIK